MSIDCVDCTGSCGYGCGDACSNDCTWSSVGGCFEDGCTGTCGDICSSGCSGDCSWSCEYSCSVCTGSCSDECAMGCNNNCKDTCTGFCDTNCYAACAESCNIGCKGNCFQACAENCAESCKNNCFTECKGKCYTTCSNECRGYCARNAQNYCNHAQTFTENLSPSLNNPIGRPEFKWTNQVVSNQPIQITRTDWNTLKSYIQAAAGYCYDSDSSPSTPSVNTGDLITAEQFNDLSKALGAFVIVEKNKTIISAEIINSLKESYNNLSIYKNSPTGDDSGQPIEGNGCCQKGQTCYTETAFDESMGKKYDCEGNQEPLMEGLDATETTSPS